MAIDSASMPSQASVPLRLFKGSHRVVKCCFQDNITSFSRIKDEAGVV